MTKGDLAALLNGRSYGDEINAQEAKQAKDVGLVVVFGYSDDNVEFEGAITDEIGAYRGVTVPLNKTGIFTNECGVDLCPYYEILKAQCKTIKAIWHDDGEYAWTFETEIPHATFDIFEDGEKFCRGIVFSMEDLA
jgi:hypothetical protein